MIDHRYLITLLNVLLIIFVVLAGYSLEAFNNSITQEFNAVGWEYYRGPDLDLPEILFALLLLPCSAFPLLTIWREWKQFRLSKFLTKVFWVLKLSASSLVVFAVVMFFQDGSIRVSEGVVIWLALIICNAFLASYLCFKAYSISPDDPSTCTAKERRKIRRFIESNKRSIDKSPVTFGIYLRESLNVIFSLDSKSPIINLLHILMAIQHVVIMFAAGIYLTDVLENHFRIFLFLFLPAIAFLFYTFREIKIPEQPVYALLMLSVVPVAAYGITIVFSFSLEKFVLMLCLAQLASVMFTAAVSSNGASETSCNKIIASLIMCILALIFLYFLFEPEIYELILADYSAILLAGSGAIFIWLLVFSQRLAESDTDIPQRFGWGLLCVLVFVDLYIQFGWSITDAVIFSLLILLGLITYPHLSQRYSELIDPRYIKLFGLTEGIRNFFIKEKASNSDG